MKDHFFDNPSGLVGSRVDRANGIIRGVSIITSGLTARGHDLQVDHTTLRQMETACRKKGTVPTKWNHKTGADAVNGYLDNFRIEGPKLLGDWHLLQTHPNFEQAVELAERMPSNVGLSAAFTGDDEPVEVNGRKSLAARCDEVISVDLVATPAANPTGLFQAKSPAAVDGDPTNETSTMSTNPNTASAQEPTLKDLLTAITTLQQTVEAQGQTIADLQEGSAQGEDLTIEDILSLSEQQISDLLQAGEISEEDAAGIAALQAEHAGADLGSQEGQQQAAPAAASAAPAGSEAGTALSALATTVRELSARFERADRAAAEAETQHYFDTIEANLKAFSDENGSLKKELSSLKAHNETLLHALRTGTRVLSFSAEGAISPVTGKDGKVHEFEQKVAEVEKEGKSRAKAFEAVIARNPELHRDWLEAQRA